MPRLALPLLVVTSLALLAGERFRAPRGTKPIEPVCGPVTMASPSARSTTVAAGSGVRGPAVGAVSNGPPSMRNLDPARTNRSPFRAPKRPRVAWMLAAGGPIAVAPVVARGRLVVGTLAGDILCLGEDGKELSRTAVGERLYGSPLVIGERVWVGADHGLLVSFNPDDGKIARRVRLDKATDDADTALLPGDSPPGGSLVVAAGPIVYGIDRDGGFRFRSSLGRKIYGSPARLLDGGLVVGGQDDAAHFLERDGAVRATVPLGADVDGSPAVADDGTVYVGTDKDEVVALRPSGEIHWRAAVGGPVRGALAVARDGAVLVSTYGPVPAVLALEPHEGALIFRHELSGTGAREYGIHGAPIEAEGGTLLFGGPDDRVHALDAAGAPLWTVDVDGDVDGALVLLADGVLVAGTSQGSVYRIEETP